MSDFDAMLTKMTGIMARLDPILPTLERIARGGASTTDMPPDDEQVASASDALSAFMEQLRAAKEEYDKTIDAGMKSILAMEGRVGELIAKLEALLPPAGEPAPQPPADAPKDEPTQSAPPEAPARKGKHK